MYKSLSTTKLGLIAISISLVSGLAAAAIPNELKLDYAYYAPTSLVVKE
ncbi:sulfonate ABC transporter substrate-binding protein [Acinetobacter sp. HR7]|nr:sulfonate ABC transporter substrate-binding protein [Acinetobacter sp. HR7]